MYGNAKICLAQAALRSWSPFDQWQHHHTLEGGFFDGFQILLDRHEILYAEGIAVESLMVTGQTRPALPEAILATAAPDLSPELRTALELDALALARAGGDPAKALYEASLGGKKRPNP